jgi:hypothetical protein
MTNPLYAQNQYGAYGSSESTNGSIMNSYGLYGYSTASGNANVVKSYGVFGFATSTDPAAVCYGVYGKSGGTDIYTPLVALPATPNGPVIFRVIRIPPPGFGLPAMSN